MFPMKRCSRSRDLLDKQLAQSCVESRGRLLCSQKKHVSAGAATLECAAANAQFQPGSEPQQLPREMKVSSADAQPWLFLASLRSSRMPVSALRAAPVWLSDRETTWLPALRQAVLRDNEKKLSRTPSAFRPIVKSR